MARRAEVDGVAASVQQPRAVKVAPGGGVEDAGVGIGGEGDLGGGVDARAGARIATPARAGGVECGARLARSAIAVCVVGDVFEDLLDLVGYRKTRWCCCDPAVWSSAA